MGFYDPNSGDRLTVTGAGGQEIGSALTVDYMTIPAPDALPAVPDHPVDLDLEGNGDQIGLLGFSLEDVSVPAGGILPLTLFWQAQGTVTKDYTVFVHLLDPAGAIRGQGDGPPAAGFYPTTAWDSGEVIVDEHVVAVDPDAPPGIYQLVVGLYELSTGVRLSTLEGDRVYLSDIEVGP